MPSKEAIQQEIAAHHPALRHEVAAKHGGVLYGLKCKTPKCGYTKTEWLPISGHKDAKIEDEWRYIVCDLCAAKGNWEGKPVDPPTASEVESGRKHQEKVAADQLSAALKYIDQQIQVLQEERKALVGKTEEDAEPVQA